MKSVLCFLILFLSSSTLARQVAKDINELYHIASFSCKASQKVEFRVGSNSFKRASHFNIPVEPGGLMKLHSTKLNMHFEALFSESINFSLKQLDAYKNFPYKMDKKTDKKTFINLDILAKNKKKPVFSLKCKKK